MKEKQNSTKLKAYDNEDGYNTNQEEQPTGEEGSIKKIKGTQSLRKLKVYNKEDIKYKGRYRPKLEIRLIGVWLKEWGFCSQSGVTVRKLETGSMIINKVGLEPPLIEL
jgi:hypothetical protein